MTDFHAVNEKAQVVAANWRIAVTQVRFHQGSELADDLRSDSALTICELAFQPFNIDGYGALPRGDIANFSGDLWIIGLVKAGAHKLDDIGALTIKHSHAGMQFLELIAQFARSYCRPWH